MRSPVSAGQPTTTVAGMPSVNLTDAARLRLDTISFFLAGFLLSAWFIKLVWNYLGKDFPSLPRLSYGRAVGLVGLWGLLFVLVLTMISGARELMTPGAWEKQGATYKLATPDEGPPAPSTPSEGDRYEALSRLWSELAEKADGGKFPAPSSGSSAPVGRLGQVPGPSGASYVYLGGTQGRRPPAPLAFEPDVFGPRRLVLFSDGSIRAMEVKDIVASRPAEERP